jgi:putative nucleotidyltransferase with HDIG domain
VNVCSATSSGQVDSHSLKVMGSTTFPSVLIHEARDLAQILLDGLPERWRHTIGVARRAEDVAATVAHDDADILVAAAWLHDIGYAAPVRDTGFHPLDGARYLDRHRWPARISALVAHHSGACFVAHAHGLGTALSDHAREESPVADALTYADQTVGPAGKRFTVTERMADMLGRHGPDSPNARAHQLRGPYLLAVAERVEQRLAALPAGGSR